MPSSVPNEDLPSELPEETSSDDAASSWTLPSEPSDASPSVDAPDALTPLPETNSGEGDRQNLADTLVESTSVLSDPVDAASAPPVDPAPVAEAPASAEDPRAAPPAADAAADPEPVTPGPQGSQPTPPSTPPASDPGSAEGMSVVPDVVSAPAPPSMAETKPPTERVAPPAGFGQLPTPIVTPRLPEEFQATPQGADWFVGTGQPLPERQDAAEAPIPPRPADHRPLIFGAILAVGMVVAFMVILVLWAFSG